MDTDEMRRRVATSRSGVLATTGGDGRPHLVPFVFALKGDTLYWAVDRKPKRSTDLQRLRNIRRDPRVGVLVDTYSDDWSHLWWVRMDGTARILTDGDERVRAVNALRGKFPQYREQPLDDAVVAIDVEEWVGWSAT
ncbi:MAG: TIGR03668 family PPOX class F420-dependent oxidoreductase [Actinobacteria bacterium]|nr:MAG: TIGR03668 family PPOX class F420-dependent oxidoreductase [Actinomycetota bacterium]